MTKIIKEQILKIRESGLANMLDVKAVFELAIKNNFNELANFIFEQTTKYTKFILTGEESI
jgi:hypothetical protein